MPSRRDKVVAHAGHLLDVFRGLRARFAILEPLLFDQEVVARLGAGRRAHGLQILRGTLLESCILGIAKLVYDGDDRSPSLLRLIEALQDPKLSEALREDFAVWHLAPTSGDEPEVIALLQAAERREEAERRIKFDQFVDELRSSGAGLESSATLVSFRAMRDQLIAHNQLAFDGADYKPLDVTTLGLKLGDLRVVIDSLERIVDLISLIFRNASFDFEGLRAQLVTDRNAFWAPSA